jgi:MFS family permease
MENSSWKLRKSRRWGNPLMKFDWWLTGLCLGRAMSQTVTMVYAAALPILQREWEMSAAKAGTISSGYQIGYAISLLIISTLADRVGARLLYIFSMIGGALLTTAFAFFARGYLSGQILYTLVALAIGGSYTTGLILITEQYTPERRGMATGFYIASSSLGYVLSLALSGLTIPMGGYEFSFYVTSVATIVGGALSWITLAGTRETVVARQKQQSFTKEVLRNKPAMLLISTYTFHCWELLGMWAWTPAFMTACLVQEGVGGLDAAGLGAYVTAGFHLAGLVASFSMGLLSDRVGRARVIMVLAGISTLCSLLFGWTIGLPFLLILTVGAIYSFASLGDSPVLSAGLTEVVTPSYLGTAFGLRSLLGFGAGAISPVVFGAILDWTNPHGSGVSHYSNWGWAFVILGLPGFGAIWAVRSLQKHEKKARISRA